MYFCAVLCGRLSGPLVENDEGHLVPALGASGEPESSYRFPITAFPPKSGFTLQRTFGHSKNPSKASELKVTCLSKLKAIGVSKLIPQLI